MGDAMLKLVIKLVEDHPDTVIALAEQLAQAGINALKKHNAAGMAG